MARLHLVPTSPNDDGAPRRESPAEPHQLHLHLGGLPDPVGEPDLFPQPELPELCLELQALFGQMDLLLDGLSPQQALQFARTCYRDADNVMRSRQFAVLR